MIRFPPDVDKAKAFDEGKRLARAVTALFPPEVKLEFEKVWHPYLLIGKKMYGGYKFVDVGKPGKFERKGLSSVRGDKIKFVKRLTDTTVQSLCDDGTPDRAIQIIEENLLMLVEDRVDPAEFVIQQKLTKAVDDYDSGTRHANVAREMMLKDIGTAPKAGELVLYVMAQHKKTGVARTMAHTHFMEERDTYRINTVHYIEKLIVEALGKLLDVPGVSRDPYRLFGKYVAMARGKAMRTDVSKFAVESLPLPNADTAAPDASAPDSDVVVLGNGVAPYSKAKMKRDKERKKRQRAEQASSLGVPRAAIGKGSLSSFIKEV